MFLFDSVSQKPEEVCLLTARNRSNNTGTKMKWIFFVSLFVFVTAQGPLAIMARGTPPIIMTAGQSYATGFYLTEYSTK